MHLLVFHHQAMKLLVGFCLTIGADGIMQIYQRGPRGNISHVLAGVEKRETLRLELRNHKGVQYSGDFTLGKQTVDAVYDTGSFEIMALSSHCSSCSTDLMLYNNDTSATFSHGKGAAEEHHYAGGSMLAAAGYETVHIGNADSSLQAAKMPFWQVLDTNMKVWTDSLADFSVIVGMGFTTHVPDSSSQMGDVVTLLERVNCDVFSVCLERGAQNPGWLTLNPTLDMALFRSVPVVGEKHWAVQLSDVKFAKDKPDPCAGGCAAIVDSGTSMIGVPPSAVAGMLDTIHAIEMDCSNLDSLPDLVFNLGEHKFVLPPSGYVIQLDHEIDGLGLHNNESRQISTCLPAFMDMDIRTDMGPVWVLGMPFLRHFHTVFDRETKALHIADQGEKCKPVAFAETETSEKLPSLIRRKASIKTKPQDLTYVDKSAARVPLWAQQAQQSGNLKL